MNKLALALAAVLYIGTADGQTLLGQDSTNRVITTAVPFLNITPDARAAALGDAGVASSPDANSAYWNSAKLVFIDKDYGGSASYTPWLGKIINDMYVFYLSGFYKIDRRQAVAFSMKYFDMGEVQFNQGPDPIADALGRYSPREFAFDVTYSRLLTEHVSIGGALRYIHSNLTGALTTNSYDASPGNSVAVDFGFYYTKPYTWKNSSLSLGATITNLGGKISYSDQNNSDFLPTNLRIGGAYKLEVGPMSTFTFLLDFNKLMVPSVRTNPTPSMLSGVFGSFTDAQGGFSEEIREITTSLGVEYWYNNTFAGRMGYFYEATDKGDRKYLTFGIGAKVDKFGMDIAYMVPTNKRESALAETLRFTVFLLFMKPTKEEAPTDQ